MNAMRFAACALVMFSVGIGFGAESNSALLIAAQKGDVAKVKALLAKGGAVNATDTKHGQTPLMLAATGGHIEVVRLLLANRADVNLKEPKFGQTALMFAALGGHVEVVKALVEKGADPNVKETKYGQTALRFAESKGHAKVVEFLRGDSPSDAPKVEGGAPPPPKVESLDDQLIAAAKEGDLAKVKALIGQGANPNARDDKGLTPFAWAARNWHPEVAEYLKKSEGRPEGPEIQAVPVSDAPSPLQKPAESDKRKPPPPEADE